MADAKTIIELAGEMSRAFMQDTRANGDKFTRLKDDSPEWMTDICRAAHDSAAMLPDDVRYGMIQDACDALAEADEEDGDRDDFSQTRSDMADNVSDYTNDRTAWLASRTDRYAYVDEAVEEYGLPGNMPDGKSSDILAMIALGMYAERDEVFGQVLVALGEVANTRETADAS